MGHLQTLFRWGVSIWSDPDKLLILNFLLLGINCLFSTSCAWFGRDLTGQQSLLLVCPEASFEDRDHNSFVRKKDGVCI